MIFKIMRSYGKKQSLTYPPHNALGLSGFYCSGIGGASQTLLYRRLWKRMHMNPSPQHKPSCGKRPRGAFKGTAFCRG